MDRPPITTPLLSARTIQSTTAAATASRLPQRRPSISSSDIPLPIGRLPILSRRTSISTHESSTAGLIAPATVSRLPTTTRRPSIGGNGLRPINLQVGSTPTTSRIASVPRTIGGVKRTSGAAGLDSETELSATKRLLSSSSLSISSLTIAHERALATLTSTNTTLSSQLHESITKSDRLERVNKSLLLLERERSEQEVGEKGRERERSEERREEGKVLRGQNELLKNERIELQERMRGLEHGEFLMQEEAKRERERAEGLEGELERERKERNKRGIELEVEKERRRKLEKGVERLQKAQVDAVDTEVVREELRRQVTHLRSMEVETAKLNRELQTYKNQHANLEVLKEAKKSLENKLRGMDELRTRSAGLEVDLQEMKREREEWLSFLEPTEAASSEFTSPRKLTKTLAASRIENVSFKEKLELREAEMRTRDRLIGELENRNAVLEKEWESMKSGLLSAEGKVKQSEKRIELRDKEVEMLKSSLATYNTEEAISQANFDSQNIIRIAQLEELLDVHKRELIESTSQVARWRGLVERYGGSTTEIIGLEEMENRKNREDEEDNTGVIVSRSLEEQLRKTEALQSELEELRNENELLVKELDALDLQVSRLSYAHNNGAYNPLTTKVLELRDNPDRNDHAIRTASLERLKDENAALLDRITTLEKRKTSSLSTSEQSEALVPRESLVSLQKEFAELQAVIEQKEKMNKRMIDAWSKKADEFRKAVFSLLGYRLDIPASGRVKVSSMYASDKNQSFTFTSSPGDIGTMSININEGGTLSEEVGGHSKYWVNERGSIPCFLAALTMTFYEESTRGGAKK